MGQFRFFLRTASEEEPKKEGFRAISFLTEAFKFSVAPSLPLLWFLFSSRVYLTHSRSLQARPQDNPKELPGV